MFTSKIKAIVVSGLILCCASSAAAQNYFIAPAGAMPRVSVADSSCSMELDALRTRVLNLEGIMAGLTSSITTDPETIAEGCCYDVESTPTGGTRIYKGTSAAYTQGQCNKAAAGGASCKWVSGGPCPK